MILAILAWAPAIILPLSTSLQILRLWRSRSATGVSALSWGLFGLANLGAYAHSAGKGDWLDPVPVLAFLLSAILDVVIVVQILHYRRRAAGVTPVT